MENNKVVVYFRLNNVKKYISKLEKTETNKLLPEYDTNIENALVFEEKKLSKNYISRISNPFHRKFYKKRVSEEFYTRRVHNDSEPDSTNVERSRFY